MRIAFILPSLANRGPIIFTKNLIDALAEYKLDITIFYFKDIVDIKFDVPCIKISPFDFYAVKGFDIVHSTMLLPDLFNSLNPFSRVKISSLHNFIKEDLSFLYSPMKSFFFSKLWSIALKRMNGLIFSSQAMQHYYCALGLKSKSVIIPYGVPAASTGNIDKSDIEIFNKIKSNGLKTIGSVCLLIKRKGIDQLIPMLVEHKNCALVLIGDGPERATLEKQAIDLDVNDRTFFLGFKEDSSRYCRYFDIYAMVSRSEGFCMAMLEAMSARNATICSNLPFYQEYFDGTEIVFFETDNVDSLSESIYFALKNRSELSLKSYATYEKTFTPKVMAKHHLDLYNEFTKK